MSAADPRARAAGWRTVVVDSVSAITVRDGCIVLQGKGTRELPLSQFGTLVIAEERCMLSAALLNALIGLTMLPIRYGGKHMQMQDAAEQFVLDVLRAVDDPKRKIKEIGFA